MRMNHSQLSIQGQKHSCIAKMLVPKLLLFFLSSSTPQYWLESNSPGSKKHWRKCLKCQEPRRANRNSTHTYLKKFTIVVKLPDIIIIKDIADVNSRAGEGVRHRTWAIDRMSGWKPKQKNKTIISHIGHPYSAPLAASGSSACSQSHS